MLKSCAKVLVLSRARIGLKRRPLLIGSFAFAVLTVSFAVGSAAGRHSAEFVEEVDHKERIARIEAAIRVRVEPGGRRVAWRRRRQDSRAFRPQFEHEN